MTKLSVAIFGAGSIGCYLGGQLAHGGVHVTFIGRERFKHDLEAKGLRLTHFKNAPLHVPISDFTFVTDPSGLSDVDVILVCVKSQDSEAAAREIAKHASKTALIVSFQNGIRNAEVLSDSLEAHTVLGGVVPFNVTGTGPGRFHSGTEGDLIVQGIDDERLQNLVSAFSRSGQVMKCVPDIKAVQWGKLLINLNNALNALTGGTLHEGLSQKPYRDTLADMIEEALGVLRGATITPQQFGKASIEKTVKILRLPTPLFRIVMALILRIDKKARSSMLDDLEMGRGTEIDYLQGEIVRLAGNTGQIAPINKAVMSAVKAAFEAGKSPKLSGEQIRALSDEV